ncbi:response regulator [Caulobacter sp. 17J65-9]|uniref:LytR/AlgR family response regulator transcription factor n=1 Tax=Caulobacter sp. 17J65-9 TaxID=2709382 RepID=UPI0013C661A5|nr:response regulator [Caulobacter sp. 17J65-9]NEX94132.1 response regulator [Caulobacter sp. 17J65-9]
MVHAHEPDRPLRKVVVVEDDPVIADSLAHYLDELGYTICAQTASPTEAMTLLHKYEPDVITLDVDLGGASEGVAVATVLRTTAMYPIVFVTGAPAVRHPELKSFEASAVVAKPFTKQDLEKGIERAIKRAEESWE